MFLCFVIEGREKVLLFLRKRPNEGRLIMFSFSGLEKCTIPVFVKEFLLLLWKKVPLNLLFVKVDYAIGLEHLLSII